MPARRKELLVIAFCALALPAVFLGACKTRRVEIPDLTGPSEARSLVPVVVAPAPTPSATPIPGSTPTPPAPDPSPTPGTSGSCKLPPGSGDGENCNPTGDSFLGDVQDAIDELVKTQPGLFDLNDSKCSNCYKVRDPQGYTSGMVAAMTKKGLCARFDGEELAIKNTNEFNDQYDILTGDLYIRRGNGCYRATCRPAVF